MKVAVVETVIPILQEILLLLNMNFGIKAVGFANGEELLDNFHRFNPEIVFISTLLPSIDGLTLGGRVRTIKPEAQLVFMISGSKQAAAAYKNLADEFLLMPFGSSSLHLLVERLRKANRRGDAGADSQAGEEI